MRRKEPGALAAAYMPMFRMLLFRFNAKKIKSDADVFNKIVGKKPDHSRYPFFYNFSSGQNTYKCCHALAMRYANSKQFTVYPW